MKCFPSIDEKKKGRIREGIQHQSESHKSPSIPVVPCQEIKRKERAVETNRGPCPIKTGAG